MASSIWPHTCSRVPVKLPRVLARRSLVLVALVMCMVVYMEMGTKEEAREGKDARPEAALGDKKLPSCIIIGKHTPYCNMLR